MNESTTEIHWQVPTRVTTGYRLELSWAVNGTTERELFTNETYIFYDRLRGYTGYNLKVIAEVSEPVKLPLTSSIYVMTGMYVITYVHYQRLWHTK